MLWDVPRTEKLDVFKGHTSSLRTVAFRDEDSGRYLARLMYITDAPPRHQWRVLWSEILYILSTVESVYILSTVESVYVLETESALYFLVVLRTRRKIFTDFHEPQV